MSINEVRQVGAVMSLPNADWRTPECGSCGGGTITDDGECFDCENCGLTFSGQDLDAQYTDPDAKPCGEPCNNTWHAPDAIRAGLTHECRPCTLPTGHADWCHHNPCEPVGCP